MLDRQHVGGHCRRRSRPPVEVGRAPATYAHRAGIDPAEIDDLLRSTPAIRWSGSPSSRAAAARRHGTLEGDPLDRAPQMLVEPGIGADRDTAAQLAPELAQAEGNARCGKFPAMIAALTAPIALRRSNSAGSRHSPAPRRLPPDTRRARRRPTKPTRSGRTGPKLFSDRGARQTQLPGYAVRSSCGTANRASSVETLARLIVLGKALAGNVFEIGGDRAAVVVGQARGVAHDLGHRAADEIAVRRPAILEQKRRYRPRSTRRYRFFRSG